MVDIVGKYSSNTPTSVSRDKEKIPGTQKSILSRLAKEYFSDSFEKNIDRAKYSETHGSRASELVLHHTPSAANHEKSKNWWSDVRATPPKVTAIKNNIELEAELLESLCFLGKNAKIYRHIKVKILI